MINPNDLCPVGVITKAHGLKGEVVCQFHDKTFTDVPTDHLLLMVEGIPVPFFIANRRQRGAQGAVLQFDDVDSADQAAELVGCEAFMEKDRLNDSNAWEPFSLRPLIGFTIEDTTAGKVGKIIDIDDQTANLLFIVETAAGNELLVPAHPDLIDDIDQEAAIITMHLPQGLIDPSQAEELPDFP